MLIERTHFSSCCSFRTLSIHVHDTLRNEKDEKGISTVIKVVPGGAEAIRAIDIHLAPIEEVFTRFSTSPTLGLESPAVQRRAKAGKNVISPPPTQYWKKALNYVFGGFNFLMWIAFIVTTVGVVFAS